MSNPTSAPFETISANDKGASVSIVNCFLIVFSGLVVLARAIIRWKITKLTAVDDVAINIALVFGIAQTVCTQLARNHGLGKRQEDVSNDDFESYSKSIYASLILTIVVMTCTKLAVSYLVQTIRPKGTVRLACLILDAIVGAWALTSILAVSFQCTLPSPWLLGTDRCINLTALYYYISVLNVITDLVLVILPLFVVWDLQLRQDKKIWVLSLFSSRILVPAAVITQLVFLKTFLNSIDGDQTWNNTNPMIINQVAVNMSIITACIPSLRRVVMELTTHQTGLKVTENLEMTIGSKGYSKHGTEGTMRSGSSKSKSFKAGSRTNNSIPYGHNVDSRVGNMSNIYASRDREKVSGDQSSEEHLRTDNIHYTVEVSVEEEDDRISSGDTKQERWT